ncbi:hypothetical protein [Pseudogulbenkiania ferrooxidans]|uniref:hypothetical protein n=1 Tax=Pseudogulbenkiania ferrooxidans TaxID=549169 RepID=UPI00135F1B7E|nr:hypothetical protein [Pseudogulbenkiania ferrooxidans]
MRDLLRGVAEPPVRAATAPAFSPASQATISCADPSCRSVVVCFFDAVRRGRYALEK